MTSHDDWADYLDPETPDPAVPDDARRALDRIAATIAAPDTWGDPPARLRSALLESVRREQAAGRGPAATPDPTPLSVGPPPTQVEAAPEAEAAPSAEARTAGTASGPATADVVPLHRRSRRAWYASTAGVAAAAVLIAVLAWPRGPELTTFPVAGTALAPKATGSVELEPKSAGLAITLHVKGLPPAPAGSYYAAWLRGAPGIVPVGTFHWRKGGIPIDLWSGVASDRYPEFFVTLQQEGRPPTPSSEIVLDGRTGG